MKEVLIVDDDDLFRQGFTAALNDANIRVAEAKDVPDGLKLAEEIKPKIIVVDHNMPGETGDVLVEKLKKEDWAKDIDIFVFSVQDDVSNINKELQAGIAGYLDKPTTTPEQAAAIIQKHLGNKS
jgi:CheY-like chemotaxis protein